jgi:soluble lytic murein transglycosylase
VGATRLQGARKLSDGPDRDNAGALLALTGARTRPHSLAMGGLRARNGSWLLLGAVAFFAVAWIARGASVEATPAADLEARATAALRSAAEAAQRGEAEVAAQRFDAVAAAVPELADHASALAADNWLAAGRAPEAEASVRRALTQVPDSAIGAALFEALGSARAAQGDAAGARAAWRESLTRDSAGVSDPTRLRLATSLADAGSIDAAAAELRTLWIGAADRAAGDAAGRQLDAMELRAGHPLRTAEDRVRRADRLFESQRSEAALVAYDAALAAGIEGADRIRAQRRRAESLFRLRRYREAEAAFAALAGDPDARVWRARALARADRVDEAIVQLESIGNEAHGSTSAWARYLAGLLYEGRGQHDRARVLFAASVDGADEKIAAQALWRLGWSAYTGGDPATARRRFRALLAVQQDPLDRLAARYWAARSLESEDADEAARELAEIAAEYPFSYYGWRAASRTDVAPVAQAPIVDGAAALGDRDLFAPRVLIAAGLRDAGQRALQPLESRAANVDDRIAIGRLHVAAGDPHRAQTLVVDAYAERLARGVATGQRELWELAWPDAFAAERRRARPSGSQLDPWFVASIMREESGYRPDVVSVSGALGLLQLMPDTAARLARDAGVEGFSASQLVRPELNLRLGALYLDQLSLRFDGALEAVAASYNAGPGAVSGWRRGASRPADAWVESIPYDETRGYAKRVLRSLHVYRTLYP